MQNALQIVNLVKTYGIGTPREHKALKGISLTVAQGDFYGLLGPNGAGKSTLINCLATTVNKTSGSIYINGYNLDTQTLNAKKSIAIVPQELNFDPFFTPLQSLMLRQGLYGITPNKAVCIELLERLGLKGKEKSPMRALSGGMKRRVLMGCALICNPKIVILDEPTAGVDLEIRKSIWELLRNLNNNGTTIILTTHYLEEAEELCKHVGIIKSGQLIVSDSKKSLLSSLGTKQLVIKTNSVQEIPNQLKKWYQSSASNLLKFTYKDDSDSGLILHELIKAGFNILEVETNASNLEDIFVNLINKNNNVSVAH